ncbi:hypothetical protein L0664_15885 [Octadecabacter sp. G9-8]|uniref:Uncharacterized protein n=1 Tax=Octadecabacter dasysiphoniae TaxID=2909341 RepID=A0ABS9D0J6_9RHOB|nr:hypothetical protein [Octadecabacter dasysiphoniae]MCF2872557.1 hypothetical protein [Octadecabacter dasysiphoniae]
MNYVDKTFLALTSPVTASGVFSQEALKAIAASSYGIAMTDLIGAATPRFDKLDLAPFSGSLSTDISRDGYSVQYGGSSGSGAMALDSSVQLVWNGVITTSAAFPQATIGVEKSVPLTLAALDADIPNPAPTVPAELEAARRVALLARLAANANDANGITDQLIKDWLADNGVTDVATLLETQSVMAALSQWVLSFTPVPGTTSASQTEFPVSAAIMVRDVSTPGFRLVDLVQASQNVTARLRLDGITPKAGGDHLPRGRPVVVWVVEKTWFDDADWPGADANARIQNASAWLATSGIALAPTT